MQRMTRVPVWTHEKPVTSMIIIMGQHTPFTSASACCMMMKEADQLDTDPIPATTHLWLHEKYVAIMKAYGNS